MTTFASALAHFRTRAGLSLNALAFRAGIYHQSIMRFEAGTRHPRRETVDTLAEALGLSPPDADKLRLAAGFAPRDPMKLVRLGLDSLMTQEPEPVSGRAYTALLALHDLQDFLTRHGRDLNTICREVSP